MVCLNILSGGYDLFVALYCFDPSNSSLTLTDRFPTGQNPSWIGFNGDKTVLYATNEITLGALQSFDVSPDGTLSSAVQTVSSGGDSPAHLLALSTGEVAIMNYNSGNGRIVGTVNGHPDQFVDDAEVIEFPRDDRNVSHPHESVEWKNGEVFVPDLGQDQIWRLTKDADNGTWTLAGNIPQSLGSGPRHIAIRDSYLYTLHELVSTLTLELIPSTPTLNLSSTRETAYIANVSTLPEYQPEGAVWAAAEILIPEPSEEFPEAYIYVSNRNVGTDPPDPVGDSIAIFQHVNPGAGSERGGKETLELVNQFFTGLDQVRGMQFDQTGRYLVAAGVAGTAGTKVFERTEGGRNFTQVAQSGEVGTRTGFVWV